MSKEIINIYDDWYGTDHLANKSEVQLLEESKILISSLFHINEGAGSINKDDYKKTMSLFEIIKFGNSKYPYLLTLEFNKEKKLESVHIWNDPLFDQSVEAHTAFTGIYTFPDLCVLSKNQQTLLDTFSLLLTETSKLPDSLLNTICIAGTKGSILNVGRARQSVFVEQLKKPVW